jgi:hypothetical protein
MPLEERCAARKRKYEEDLEFEIAACELMKEEVQRREAEIDRRKALWSPPEVASDTDRLKTELTQREEELHDLQTEHVQHQIRYKVHEAEVNRQIAELKHHKRLMRDYKGLLDKFETGLIDFQLAMYTVEEYGTVNNLEDFDGLKGDFECLNAELAML